MKENHNMFRDMRRKNKQLPVEAARSVLLEARRGVIAVNGDDGYPYAVPVNFLYIPEDGKIYIHGSAAGHKADSLRRSDKVCFTAYSEPEIKDEKWAPYVSSAVVFGRCRMIQEPDEVSKLIRMLAGKYYPSAQLIEEEIQKSAKAATIFEITVEHLSGKRIQER